MTASDSRLRIQRAARAIEAAVLRPVSSTRIWRLGRPGAWARTNPRCAAPQTTRICDEPTSGRTRSRVIWKRLLPRNHGRNCFGREGRVAGHRRDPDPPASTTANTGSLAPSVEESISENAADRTKAVLPGDFLASLVVTPVIGNGDFVDPAAQAGYLRRELWLEAEPVRP